jgi:hypothetical protein
MQPFFLHNRDIFETREKKVSNTDSAVRCLKLIMISSYSPKLTAGLLSSGRRRSLRFHT